MRGVAHLHKTATHQEWTTDLTLAQKKDINTQDSRERGWADG